MPGDPSRAFFMINRRILWLSHRIQQCQANGDKYGLYLAEREALIWAVDKIKELSAKMIDLTTQLQASSELDPIVEALKFGGTSKEIATEISARLGELYRTKEELVESRRTVGMLKKQLHNLEQKYNTLRIKTEKSTRTPKSGPYIRITP